MTGGYEFAMLAVSAACNLFLVPMYIAVGRLERDLRGVLYDHNARIAKLEGAKQHESH